MKVSEARKITITTLVVLVIIGVFGGGIGLLFYSDHQDKIKAEQQYCVPRGATLEQRVYVGDNHWFSLCQIDKKFILVDEAASK